MSYLKRIIYAYLIGEYHDLYWAKNSGQTSNYSSINDPIKVLFLIKELVYIVLGYFILCIRSFEFKICDLELD